MLFILVAFGILALMHYVVFHHVVAAWPGGIWLVGSVLGLLLLSPFLMFFSRLRGWHDVTRWLARVGFSWMGLLFVADCLFGFMWLLELVGRALGGSAWSPGVILAINMAGTLAIVAYGKFEARRPRCIKIRLKLSTLNGHGPIRLVQLSDLHLGYVANASALEELVARVNAEKPDVIVSTGDLFDGDYARMGPVVEILKGLEAPLGRFAVSGNHEVYEGLEAGVALTREAGFRVLRGEAVEVRPGLCLLGVDDAEALPASAAKQQEGAAFAEVPPASAVILLKHRPKVLAETAARFDLQLSGHTHGGQIVPFNLLTRLAFRYRPGLQRVSDRGHLYLSRGTGTWGPQFRVLAPPEFTVFELFGD